jgi:hypothetical protein
MRPEMAVGFVKSLGLDKTRFGGILGLSHVGTTNRQTDREVGAQSEGSRTSEIAWLPKTTMSETYRFRPVLTCHLRDRGVRWPVGPGLFLALALACLAAPAAAEQSVGLDAKGVDPLAAVSNAWGLDVRDELGRPVSGEKVLGELKRASAARAAANAFTSKLKDAAALFSSLELLERGSASLWAFSAALPAALATAGLPGPRPKIAAVLPLLLGFLAITCAVLRLRPALLPLKAGRCCPEVLRC